MATEINMDTVNVGDDLPALAIEITPRLVIGAAIASRDYQDVHHDYGAATSGGTPDIFMNILTTMGLVSKYITGWAGPRAWLKSTDVKLGYPNFPGDTMKLTGEVVAKGADSIDIEVKGKNAGGYHVTGTVCLSLPQSEAAQ